MRILNLIAENYKRLQVVEVTPEGNLVDIKGRNAQGKSSLLDSIYAALAGASALPSKPIRKGADKARIELKLGDGETVELVVKRTFARKDDTYTTAITVENAEGATYRSPQTLLDGLLGALSFDPLAFTRMAPKDQLQELRKLVPGVDFDAIDKANGTDYERRTVVNRQVKTTQARLAALKVPGDPRAVRIDEAALVSELDKAGEQKAATERENARRAQLRIRQIDTAAEAAELREDAQMHRVNIGKLRDEIATLEAAAKDCDDTAAKLEAQAETANNDINALPPLEAPVDTSEVIKRIQDARTHNRAIDERERVLESKTLLAAELTELETQSETLTAAITERNTERADAVASANLPIEGLAFGDDEVLFNELPLDQASDAERLRVSVAIAAAMNSKLKVIRVRDGSLLDEDGMRLLAAFADEHDLQIWCERVSSDAGVGIVIEDGMVKQTEAA